MPVSPPLSVVLAPAASSLLLGVGLVLALMTLVGIGYQLFVLRALGRWFAGASDAPPASSSLAVTLLKPLYGAEPGLAARLAGFLAVRHAGPLQMVCGVGSPRDGALPAVTAFAAAHAPPYSDADIAVTLGPRRPGANGKVGNLAAMMPFAAHDVLVLSDSDMSVGPDYLERVLGALAAPGVGAVSCLYRGAGDAGLWSTIGAAAISYATMPNMALALAHGLAQPCMGSTIALTRETLDRIGGFPAFADVLADDHAIGAAVAGLGLKVAVPPMLLVHHGHEASFAALWRQHLRWAATVRSIAGARHWGSVVTHPLALALLTMALLPATGAVLVALALGARIAVATRVDRIAHTRCQPLIALIAADILGFAIFCASLFAQKIDWRGSRLVMAADGRIQQHN